MTWPAAASSEDAGLLQADGPRIGAQQRRIAGREMVRRATEHEVQKLLALGSDEIRRRAQTLNGCRADREIGGGFARHQAGSLWPGIGWQARPGGRRAIFGSGGHRGSWPLRKSHQRLRQTGARRHDLEVRPDHRATRWGFRRLCGCQTRIVAGSQGSVEREKDLLERHSKVLKTPLGCVSARLAPPRSCRSTRK